MVWHNILTGIKKQLNNSSGSNIHNNNNNNALERITKFAITQKLKKIKMIQDYFYTEKEQVDTVIRLFYTFVRKNPVGYSLKSIVDILKEYEMFNIYNHNTVYLLSILNTLALINIGILEISPENGLFNLTSFGYEYWQESLKIR